LKKALTVDAMSQLTDRVFTEDGHLPGHDSNEGVSGFMGSKFKVAPNVDQTQVYDSRL